MGLKKIVDASFWTDSKVDEFSPEDKYFMLYLLTNPFSTLLGVYEISVKQAAFQMGYSVDAFKALLDRFENKYHMIAYSKETGEVAIRNFLRYSVIKGGEPVEACIKREMDNVKNRSLIDYVFSSVRGMEGTNKTISKIIQDYDINNPPVSSDYVDDSVTEYEYVVSGYDTPSDTATNRKTGQKKPKNPPKHKYGEHNNVLLTDEELDKLKTKFPDWAKRIEDMSLGIASKGYKYKSHYAAILSWARRDEEKGKDKKPEYKAVPDGYEDPLEGLF